MDFEKCDRILNEVDHDIQSATVAFSKLILLNGPLNLKDTFLKHNPVQPELINALSKNLKELEAEIKRNNFLTISSSL